MNKTMKTSSARPKQAFILESLRQKTSFWLLIEKNRGLSISYFVFLLIYICFDLIPRPNEIILHRYHLSPAGLRLIDLTIIIILAVIWGFGFYGLARLRAYTRLVRKRKEGQQFEIISRGIFLLVLWLPITEDISVILRYMSTRYPDWSSTVAIINNYVNLILPLGAFILIGMGARRLRGLVKARYAYYVLHLLMLVVVYAGIIYAHLVATTLDRTKVYHMSLWLILLTLVAPYVYMWFIGVIAAYDIHSYQKEVTGILYRRSLRLLSLGLGWLIATSIIFQFVTAVSAHLTQLSIYLLLAIVYALLIILSLGFILITMGASKLQKIEEI